MDTEESKREAYIQSIIEELDQSEIEKVVPTVMHLRISPVGDESIIARLEKLLGNRRLDRLSIPYRYGEIRYLAAYALAAERAVLGDKEPFYLEDTFRPMTSSEITTLAIKSGLLVEKAGALEQLRILVEHDAIPRHRQGILDDKNPFFYSNKMKPKESS